MGSCRAFCTCPASVADRAVSIVGPGVSWCGFPNLASPVPRLSNEAIDGHDGDMAAMSVFLVDDDVLVRGGVRVAAGQGRRRPRLPARGSDSLGAWTAVVSTFQQPIKPGLHRIKYPNCSAIWPDFDACLAYALVAGPGKCFPYAGHGGWCQFNGGWLYPSGWCRPRGR